MEIPEAVRTAKLKKWATIFEDRNQSGITISAYCQANGITKSTYFYWLHECREAALKTQSTSFVELVASQCTKEIAQGTGDGEGTPLRIRYGQALVEVGTGTSQETLRMVLRVLREC